ncbi:MAG: heme exporter protein CcmD [Acidiphilium sp.]
MVEVEVHSVMPFVAGSYGAAVVILAFIAGATTLRYRAARRLLATVETRERRP